MIGLPSEAFADAGGWFHPPVEYTSTVEADNEVGKLQRYMYRGASDHMDQNMACCSACAFVTGRIVKKANNYIDRLHWYRIVAAIVSFCSWYLPYVAGWCVSPPRLSQHRTVCGSGTGSNDFGIWCGFGC